MARTAPTRTEQSEIRRQIGFHEALKARVYRKADDKANEYQSRIDSLKQKLEEMDSEPRTDL
jgi:hypothetical protein